MEKQQFSPDLVRNEFGPSGHYLDTATLGIPPKSGVSAMKETLQHWQDGTLNVRSIDNIIRASCSNFANIINTSPENVGIISQLSTVSGMVASSLPLGSKVLVAKEDFTSVTFPFYVMESQGRLVVETVDLDKIIESVNASFAAVAVSAVQSSDGRVLDLEALAHTCDKYNVKTFIDFTQAAGWVKATAEMFDVVACHAYKWLCSPRGTGFIVTRPSAREWLVPIFGGWYAGEDPWDSIYGPPLRLAGDARAYQLSPDWLSWRATEIATKFISAMGPEQIGQHNIKLANHFRSEVGLKASNSAIVSVDCDLTEKKLQESHIVASFRDGRLRSSFHMYNTEDDVEALLKALFK